MSSNRRAPVVRALAILFGLTTVTTACSIPAEDQPRPITRETTVAPSSTLAP